MGLRVAVDTTFDPDRSPKEAKLATGSLLNLCDAVITGRVKNGFALIRPPGHHAEPGIPLHSSKPRVTVDAAMGFCIYNNVGVAAKWVLQRYPQTVKRILIIDWDVQYQPFVQTSLIKSWQRNGKNILRRPECFIYLDPSIRRWYILYIPHMSTLMRPFHRITI